MRHRSWRMGSGAQHNSEKEKDDLTADMYKGKCTSYSGAIYRTGGTRKGEELGTTFGEDGLIVCKQTINESQ
jgi:hypothetical protein